LNPATPCGDSENADTILSYGIKNDVFAAPSISKTLRLIRM